MGKAYIPSCSTHLLQVLDVDTKAWRSVNLPLPIHERIKRVYPWLGFSSIAEYVREAVREKLRSDEWKVGELENKYRRDKEEDAEAFAASEP